MNKKNLTEADIRTKFITPAILGPGGTKWDSMTQMLEEHFFTKGRVIVRGKTVSRGDAKKADYLLFYKPNIQECRPIQAGPLGDAVEIVPKPIEWSRFRGAVHHVLARP
jgi:hypothetical protein